MLLYTPVDMARYEERKYLCLPGLIMRGYRKFCPRGSKFTNLWCVFLLMKMIQIPLYADHHWPTSQTTFKWRFAGMPMMV